MSPRISPVRAAAGVVALCGLLAGCAGTNAASDPGDNGNRFISGDGNVQKIAAAKRKAPLEASGTTLDGKPVKLSELRGKVAVVNFWASWCAPCRGEATSLQQVYDENKDKGVAFLGVNFKDAKENARAFDRRFKITYPSVFDGDGQIGLAFRDVPPNAIPSTLVLDRQGRVAVRIIGATTYSKLGPLVAATLAEK
ncbi:TlpA family protein disulfide reductase [Actinomadura atramentaria]|uniref:TlpA family protein disulfide reductase n=1 Tax=Actinomadura atramentaria TaxID=1990 RepID=UPI0003A1F3DD|nr:TlpA disulfide reductase family protein [Actinomadura atramentaria]